MNLDPATIAIAYITIGRNIGDTPMEDARWQAFQERVWRHMADTIGEPQLVLAGPGGEWNGMPEDCAVFMILDPLEPLIPSLRRSLAQCAHDFGQEAVALAIGRSELLSPAGVIARAVA